MSRSPVASFHESRADRAPDLTPGARRPLDLARDLREVTRLGATGELIDEVVGEGLEALGHVIPYDLATVMELEDRTLSVRIARGRLADPRLFRHRLRLDDFPSLDQVLAEGRARAFTERDHSVGDGDPFDGVLDFPHGHSCMVAPVRTGNEVFGVMTLDREVCGEYPTGVVRLADVFAQLLGMVINYGEQSARLERLRRQLEEHSRLLSERAGGRSEACRVLEASRSPAMTHVTGLARQVAVTEVPVLITGETGTGKELLANAIHAWSRRANRPFVAVNCAALPASLVETELFGHVRGAFTGATGHRLGRFQTANGGTLFLDEVGELPQEIQGKLLRVLQEGSFEPVGSDRTVRVDVRVVAATNRSPVEEVAARKFREDLYYRLAVFPIHVPPLRARPEDIAGIVTTTLETIARREGRGSWSVDARDVRELEAREWRGNVRELVNVIERAAILSPGSILDLAAALRGVPEGPGRGDDLATLEEAERRHIREALRRSGGKVHGPGGAAKLLAIHPSTLRSRMAKLGIRRTG